MNKKLTTEELSELMRLYNRAGTTPVMCLSLADGLAGRDFASIAYQDFQDKWAEIAKKYGVRSSAGFDSTTGEIDGG